MILGAFEFSAAQVFFVLLQMGLHFTELVNELVVLQNLDVFDMEVGFVLAFEFFVWSSWVDTLQDAKLAEVRESELKSSNGI